MPSVLLVLTGANTWGLTDGTQHPTGFWADEFISPHRAFVKAGFDVTVATPGGVVPPVDELSLSPAMNGDDAERIAELRNYLGQVKGLLSAPSHLEDVNPDEFDALFVAGGHGPLTDLAVQPDTSRVALALLDNPAKVVAAVCHATAAFLPAHRADGSWAFEGRRLTGFTDEEETIFGLAAKAPWLVESRLREAGAEFVAGAPYAVNVITDGNVITGQNPASAGPTAETVIKALALRS
jgi:putative intracellular protease/amidase